MTADNPADQPATWSPEFEGQRAPFTPGHQLSTQHGAYSPRQVDPIAEGFVTLVLTDPATAYLQAVRWRPAVNAWARAEAQVQLLTDYLTRQGQESGDGVGDLEQPRVNSAYLLLHRAEARATSGRRQLGLDPLSAARLGRDKTASALDVAKLMARLAASEEARNEGDTDD